MAENHTDEALSDENEGTTIREKKISAPLWKIADRVEQILVKGTQREKEENDYKKHSLRWMKWGVISSTFFALLSAGIAFLTYTILKNQTTILENQSAIQAKQFRAMQIDQRAWINVQYKIDAFSVNMPLHGEITITNTGKTPAKQLSGFASIQKVAGDKPPKFDDIIVESVSTGLLPPNAQIPISTTRRNDVSILKLTTTDIEEIASGDAYVAIFGKVRYLDLYDNPHWIKFCFWKDYRAGSYSAQECVKYNEIDKD